jgi:hypothetical protein
MEADLADLIWSSEELVGLLDRKPFKTPHDEQEHCRTSLRRCPRNSVCNRSHVYRLPSFPWNELLRDGADVHHILGPGFFLQESGYSLESSRSPARTVVEKTNNSMIGYVPKGAANSKRSTTHLSLDLPPFPPGC